MGGVIGFMASFESWSTVSFPVSPLWEVIL